MRIPPQEKTKGLVESFLAHPFLQKRVQRLSVMVKKIIPKRSRFSQIIRRMARTATPHFRIMEISGVRSTHFQKCTLWNQRSIP
jgi:hypothetical protein